MPPKRSPAPKQDVFDVLAKRTGASRERVIEECNERAAIREYLGGMPRLLAEREAISDVQNVLGRRVSAGGKP
jgi:hypothetical protein